ncbi:bacteriohemerythrin [Helicobacter saguini]|uniref:Bacteriohemerythrin n=1 Tax=Helicobacter saguini TaxID=1548018 RepID=A0A347VMV3_9HELI|nr:hemerythrin family protein [Helicobacter saguini]MWV62011.1 bacteriohemerythrin [Helicobacter saguini]MWV67314.1 bacteriohemerythrin [Helicobacter saguini]MWV69667.1 bacteriohemerythrin [Helicobacter saguini]MWV73116.1 bacteriohemerythrin [Helicobacter saguini]TLD95518.1 bacteriohemerythrin [Helicobacter saguini]
MLPKWSNEYSVHNFMIDEQHKKLFEIANIADNMIGRQTDALEIKKVLIALFEYMKTHFKDEEAYMKSINYPGFESHAMKHRSIISEMTLLVKNMKHDFKQQLAIITEQWLLKHILQDDMMIGEYQLELLAARRKQDSIESTSAASTPSKEDVVLAESSVESIYSSKSSENKATPLKKDSVLHIYTCLCGKVYNIADNIHEKIQNGGKIYCKHCKNNITFINDMKV